MVALPPMALLDGFFTDEDPSVVQAAIDALMGEGPGPFDRSFGAVTDTDTHCRRKPDSDRIRLERSGLFCPTIFGPDRELLCDCGALSGEEQAGTTCTKCGVLVGSTTLRSQRFGHIEV